MDLKSSPIWYPYTQEKLADDPIIIEKAQGAYLYPKGGEKVYDAISSWWVNIHGHSHPYINKRLNEQLSTMEQTIFAGHTHVPAINLAKRILEKLGNKFHKVFFSDNGSTSVECALKMSLQFWKNQGIKRQKILAFNHGFHGETFGTRAVGNCLENISELCQGVFEIDFIEAPIPGTTLSQLEEKLASNDYAAFIFEPIIQGVRGMVMQDINVLDSMIKLCQEKEILCIADEVMTGFGRTGKMFAIDYLENKPDIVCLAKALTGGTLPLALTVCNEKVHQAFYSDDLSKALLYGHSFAGNALGCAAAHASLDLLEKAETINSIEKINSYHLDFAQEVKGSNFKTLFKDIRIMGTIIALEYKSNSKNGYFNELGPKMKSFFRDRNVLLRPLGNVIYIIPPYCSKQDDLKLAYEAIWDFSEGLND
ncbi:MAG: adenosylmethionine--8-amino-7-oxononanoate transaminase [Epsilonproteobacteria bacterium]|nr:MAG: adenosylmethionine--8-amino-7-oxononanoate transaminase [Campylobacterota bacterium]RLA66054.1 MAG: adenosylmethionine--8-amino-7-oxononanoate transaminase [Campylobacterota bacterium]